MMAYLPLTSQCVRFCTLVVYWTLFPSLCIDAAMVWTKPPPVHTPSSRGDTRTTNIQLVNGSSEARLIWDFTLTGETLDKIFWEIDVESAERIGIKRPSGATVVIDKFNYLEHFNISASDPATLIIYDVTEADEAPFSCSVENDLGETWKDIIQVEIVVESKLTSFNGSQQTVCKGDDITLLCDATGKPDPNVTWTRVWKNGSNSEVRYTGNVFALNNINRDAEGTYRCTAYNGVGKSVNHTVNITVNVASYIEPMDVNQTATEGTSNTFYCNAPGKPSPLVSWTKIGGGQVGIGHMLNFTRINRTDAGEYKCEATNECGNASAMTSIIVEYAPSILYISANKSVNENDGGNLTCTADGIPAPDITWTRVSDNSPVSFNFTITGKQDEGYYRCTANNGVGTPASKDVYITVENYHPFETQLHTSLQNDIVELNVMFNITCSAQANPPAMYRLKKDDVFNGTSGDGVFTRHVSDRMKQVTYGCIPNNSFGDGPEKNIAVTVYYPARVTGITITPRGELFDEGRNVSITCQVGGNPMPNITWTKEGSDKMFEESDTIDFAPASRNDTGTYNCTASNGVGAASSANISFEVQPDVCQNCSGSMKLRDAVYNESLKNMESEDSRNLTKTIEKGMEKAMNGTEYNRTRIDEYGRGSVVVFFTLVFNEPVDGEMVISLLKSATSRGDFGDLGVDATSIMLIQATVPPSTTTRPPTPSPSPSGENDCSSTFYTEDCEWKHLWTIIFVVLVVVVVLIVGVVVWRVLKIRKCRRKSPKVANTCTGEEGHVLQEFPDGAYAQVNQSYAKSGPAPANEYDQGAAGASAVPPVTYAVVDKSKKNEKPPDYAVVDKSKKKKKSGANEEKPPVVLKSQKKKNPEEPEQQYAQVDRSMKKKHAKPGEVLYADLGEFHGNNSLPKVATSPELLPPTKKPPAYVETQYADITQFLKGDATLPPSDGTGGVTSAAATPPGEEAGGGSSHVSKL